MAAQALLHLLLPTDRFVKIFTDSQATLLALHNTFVTSQSVKNTILSLNTLSRHLRNLTISWIKAHLGHMGNKRADELARACTNFPISSSDILPSPSTFKWLLWDHMYEIWHNEWQNHPHCRMSKNFLPKPSPAKSKILHHLSRGQMRRISELIAGQSNLNYVQSKIDPANISLLCHFCEEEDETFAHLLNEYPCFISFRRDILHNKPIINTLSWSPQQLLTVSYIPGIDNALSFDQIDE